MKIAFFVSTFYPRVGGMGKVCLKEAINLSKNHEVTVFTLDYKDENLSKNLWPFKIVRLSSFYRIRDGGFLPNLNNFLADFDLIHLHYPFYGALAKIISAKKLIGFPLLVTYHMDAQNKGLIKIIQNFYDFIYARKLFRLADKVFFVDKDYFNFSKFKKYISNEKIVYLPNGVDNNIFFNKNSSWSDLGFQELENKKVVLFVGNFLPVKNLPFLISLLKDLSENICLLVIGGGYDEKNIKNISIDSAIKKRIFFTGHITDEQELASYYSLADLVAVPSFSESFSLVTVEAMASGAIVLANDIPGIKDRIDNNVNGFLVNKNDRILWLEKIKKILYLSNEEKLKIKLSAREKASTYSWINHIKKLEEIYNEFD